MKSGTQDILWRKRLNWKGGKPFRRKREEQRKKLRRPGKPESLKPGTRRPLLKSTNTECPGKNEMVYMFDFPSESESENESRREVPPFEVYTPSESDDEVISNIV